MKDIKVYIIDSHVLVRQMMISVLRTISGVKVLGSTSGQDVEGALYNIKKLNPDVVLSGIEHLESDEMQLFSTIRKEWPRLPVIVMAPRNRTGATAVFKALKAGAVDYITLPERYTTVPLAKRHFLKRVVPLLRLTHRLNVDLLENFESGDSDLSGKLQKFVSDNRTELVAVGGDTGGVKSLVNLLSGLPESFSVPVVVAQHVPRYYGGVLAEELDKITPLKVRIASHESAPLPGHVYIAPGGKHLEVKKDGSFHRMILHQGPREQRCRPSIDALMRSASQACTDKVLAIFLSGGGLDGVKGARDIVGTGGAILVESKKSALLWDLSRHIVNQGFPVGTPAKEHSTGDVSALMTENAGGWFMDAYDENQGFLPG